MDNAALLQMLQQRGAANNPENVARLRSIIASNPQMAEASALGLKKTDDDSGMSMIDSLMAKSPQSPPSQSGIAGVVEPQATMPTPTMPAQRSTGAAPQQRKVPSQAESVPPSSAIVKESTPPTDAAAGMPPEGDPTDPLYAFAASILGQGAAARLIPVIRRTFGEPNANQQLPPKFTPGSGGPLNNLPPKSPVGALDAPLPQPPAGVGGPTPPPALAAPTQKPMVMFSDTQGIPPQEYQRVKEVIDRFAQHPGLQGQMRTDLSGLSGLIAGGPSASNLDQAPAAIDAFHRLPYTLQVSLAKAIGSSPIFSPEFIQAAQPKIKSSGEALKGVMRRKP